MECTNPSSCMNWTALRAARTFNVSVDAGLGIFSAKATMTCPLLFRTTTPIPAWSDSTNIAPSKFVFTTAPSGGFHLMSRCVEAFTPDRVWLWNSLSREAALSRIFPNGVLGSLHLTLFLRHQMNQAIVAKSSSWVACSPTKATRSVNCDIPGWSFKIHPRTFSHTVRSWLHSHNACIVLSFPMLQCGHVGSSSIFLRSKLHLVGKALEHARHKFFLILFGTLTFQRRLQKTLPLVISDPKALFWVSNSQSNWYPVFTEYNPSLHLGQIM